MEDLMNVLRQGVSPFHVMQHIKENLLEQGFQELFMEETWELEPGRRYYVNLYGTNGLAFCVGNEIKPDVSFRIGMAHSDYPCFQIKPGRNLPDEKMTRWNVDIYGGMNQKSWLDRPLGVAGCVIVKGETVFSPECRLYKSDKALAVIPSLAIHMDREVNKKGVSDVEKEFVPLAGLSTDLDLLDEIANTLEIQKSDILDYDLYLYNMQEPVMVGLDQNFISSPRLDNLTSVGALFETFSKGISVPDNTIDMMAVWDNEEVGSRSKQGADSDLLVMLVDRIGKLFNKEFDLNTVINKSFLLSADVAHGHHPNYGEKSDRCIRAYLGDGVAIKRSVGQKYGTTAQSAAVLKGMCEEHSIPYTIAINKTGIVGGSTIGPIASSYLPMPCADVGMPILAMHSATELGVVDDYRALQRLMELFFEVK